MKMWDSDHDGYENKIDSMHMGGWYVFTCVSVCVCVSVAYIKSRIYNYQ